MDVNDAVQLMGVVQSLYDGSLRSAEQVDHLNKSLIANPDNFPDEFWSTLNPPSEQTKELFAKGVVNEESTWAVLKQISEKGDDAQ